MALMLLSILRRRGRVNSNKNDQKSGKYIVCTEVDVGKICVGRIEGNLYSTHRAHNP
jgi:hypothetical protein